MGFRGGGGRVRDSEEEETTMPRVSWRPSLIIIAAGLMLTGLAIAHARPSHRNPPQGSALAPWTVHIRQVDDALSQNDMSAALKAWHDAYAAALGSRRWEGMVEAGDAYLRIGDAGGVRKGAEPIARLSYLAALFRARQHGSLDGVLRTAEAFAALGDREVVDQCIRIAERLAAHGRDAQARDRVVAFTERWGARVLGVDAPRFDLF